ncbi:hypothetical protein K491DRAFT_662718 [Lophiostoma macrostomum CBS 122681]|uniref:RRM domain-containing protein n=1 Tax=Lophiostoma macrostomum CBS 122681 TaxID=1314788 RepID=A0A6A6T3B5_9PLEO|nr:hypothetical protein K491DRAFT_662718 [Lophiostoma macrostomum CBS 122681]
MPPNDKAGRVVFIGNIPYGITEEQIVETLSRVGQVLSFRLVYDKETGRPKGFGFAEFADADAAASAVRNLNEHEVMGRKLRVDWSNDNGAGDAAPTGYSAPAAPPNGQPEPPAPQQSSSFPPFPPGVDLPPNLTCPDAISRTLSTLPAPQLLDIISQTKGLVMTDPGRATDLFREAPQLAYAIFQSLLLLGLVDAGVLTQIVEQNMGASAQAPQQPPPPAAQPPRQQFAGYPPQPAPTPPVHAQPPPQAYGQPPAAQMPQLAHLTPEQQHHVTQLLQLTPEMITTLPAEHQQQIIMLRQQYGIR